MKKLLIMMILLTITANAYAFDVKVERINRINGSAIKAFVDINIDGVFIVKGLRVINGKKGLFVVMPQKLGKDDVWYDTALPITKEARQQIIDIVLAEYSK